MVSPKNPNLDQKKVAQKPIKTSSHPKQPKILAERELETRVIQVLEKHEEQGLTCGEISKKCRSDWRRGLAIKLKSKRVEAGSQDIQSFLYDLWTRGLLFSEPPGKGKLACRFWSMGAARKKFPLSCPSSLSKRASTTPLSKQQLKSAYDKFVPEHLGGFVPIFKVRRELTTTSKEDFDKLLRELNEKDHPTLELLGGDPQKYTEDQKKDSFWRGDNLFLRMRWSET